MLTYNDNTRFSLVGNYHIKYSRRNQQLKSFSKLGAKILNSIPPALCKLPKCVIKKNIQNRLLQVLIEEDDYVGTPSLVIKKVQSRFVQLQFIFYFIYLFI